MQRLFYLWQQQFERDEGFFKVNLELHKESGDATVKNLFLVADRIISTRII